MRTLKRFTKYVNGFSKVNVTRSYGLLERFLAAQRAKVANRFISSKHRPGRILDIGCSAYPIFLLTSKFVEKFGIDKTQCRESGVLRRVKFVNYDIENGAKLPFDNSCIDVVTMLAVMEHIKFSILKYVISEVYRVLKSGGVFIITIPSPWAEYILDIMASLKLVSKIEMEDHKSKLGNAKLLEILKAANFGTINFGYFEFFVNRWFVAKK